MSLVNHLSKEYDIPRYAIKQIVECPDKDFEDFLDALKADAMRSIVGSKIDRVYQYALREAERRLSMAGARERFKRERGE